MTPFQFHFLKKRTETAATQNHQVTPEHKLKPLKEWELEDALQLKALKLMSCWNEGLQNYGMASVPSAEPSACENINSRLEMLKDF